MSSSFYAWGSAGQSLSSLDTATLNEISSTTQFSVLSLPYVGSTRLSFKRFACFFSLALCITVSAFDSAVVPTTIPTLTTVFHAGSVVQLVSPVFLMSKTSCQMLYGRFSDIIGRKLALFLAISVFMVGSFGAGCSRTLVQLLVFRGIAGAGGGGIISLVQIVVSDMIAIKDRPKYQTIIGSIIAFGYAIGPLISGAFLEKASWRWCFWISTPVSFVALVGIMATLPRASDQPPPGKDTFFFQERDHFAQIATGMSKIDLMGAILIFCGCISLILSLIWAGVLFPWASAPVLAPLFCGLFTLVIFCIWEWKGTRFPILPLYIFRYTTVTGVYLATFIYGYIHFSTLFYLPQFLQVILGYNPIRAGIIFIPFLITTVALSWIASFIVNHTSKPRRYKNMIHGAYVILTLACAVVMAITKSHVVEVVALMVVAGAGAGQTLQTPIIAVQNMVSKEDVSAVTAFKNFIRCFGGTFTLPIGSTIIHHFLRVRLDDLAVSPSLILTIIRHPASLTSPSTLGISPSTAMMALEHGYATGFKAIFVVNAVLTAIATIISILMVREAKPSSTGEKDFDHRSADLEKTVGVGHGELSRRSSLTMFDESFDHRPADSEKTVGVGQGEISRRSSVTMSDESFDHRPADFEKTVGVGHGELSRRSSMTMFNESDNSRTCLTLDDSASTKGPC